MGIEINEHDYENENKTFLNNFFMLVVIICLYIHKQSDDIFNY